MTLLSSHVYAQEFRIETSATYSLNLNQRSSASYCDAYSPSNSANYTLKLPMQTHGIPTPATGSDRRVYLSCYAGKSQGIAIAHRFERFKLYDIRISFGNKPGINMPHLAVELANIDYARNTDCELYQDIPQIFNQVLYNDAPVVGTGEIKITNFYTTADFEKLWLFTDPNFGDGSIALANVTISEISVTTATTSTSQPLWCGGTVNNGQICGSQSFYGMTTTGPPANIKPVGGFQREAADKVGELAANHDINVQNVYYISAPDGHTDRVVLNAYYYDRNGNPYFTNQLESDLLKKYIIKHDYPDVEIYSIRKELEAFYCTEDYIFFKGGCKTRIQSKSNTVNIVLSKCADPRAYPRKIYDGLTVGGPKNNYSKCTTNPFSFSIEGTPDCYDISDITWTLPTGWSWNGNGTSTGEQKGKWANSISIYPFTDWKNANQSIPGGILSAKITFSDLTQTTVSFTIPSLPAPQVTLDPQGSVVICKNQGATVNTIVPAGANYSYAWGGGATGALNITGGTSSNKLQLSSQQWAQDVQWVTLTVTNPATLCKSATGIDVYPSPRWISTRPGGNSAYVGVEILSDANIAADKVGNIYYVGKAYDGTKWNNGIFTYQWDGSAKTWRNFAYLFPRTTPSGILVGSSSLAVTTDQNGKRRLYFVDSNKQLNYVDGTSTNEYTAPSPYNPVLIAGATNVSGGLFALYNTITQSDDVLYISNDQLWLYRNGNKTPISPANSDIGDYPIIVGSKVIFTMNSQIYISNIAGSIISPPQAINYSSDNSPALLASSTLGDGSIVAFGNYVYYTDKNTSYLAQVDLTTLKASILRADAAALGNGNLSINQATGVIYYGNYESGISQLYKGGNVAGCNAPVWNASQVYQSTNPVTVVEYNGILYKANYWSQGKSPVDWAGGAGSGQPWTSLGACNSNSGTSGDTWQVSQISNSTIKAYGYIKFAYPNVFYANAQDLNGLLHIGMTYFYTGSCEPGIQRMSDEAATSDETGTKEPGKGVKIWPNPASSNYSVSLQLTKDANVYTELTSVVGGHIATLSHGQFSAGQQQLNLCTEGLNSGTYILRLYSDEEALGLEKLVVIH